jgi:hypothetical protein
VIYINSVKEKIKKLPKQKAIAYLRGAIAVNGSLAITKKLKELLEKQK